VRLDLYDIPFITVFRALYHHRCGLDLEETYTRWHRAAGHRSPVHYTDHDYQLGHNAFQQLPAAATGVKAQVTGGYHDAGDYDRRIEHLVAVDALVDLYEMFPSRFGRDDLGLPESNNGVPDVLDEAWWALALYVQLQDKNGGVRADLETTGHPSRFGLMPADDPAVWYAYGVDPRSSYRFAGAAAKLARALSGFDAAKREEILSRARRAFTWAQDHRPKRYGTEGLDVYAAAELFEHR
jgi:endoglucanase